MYRDEVSGLLLPGERPGSVVLRTGGSLPECVSYSRRNPDREASGAWEAWADRALKHGARADGRKAYRVMSRSRRKVLKRSLERPVREFYWDRGAELGLDPDFERGYRSVTGLPLNPVSRPSPSGLPNTGKKHLDCLEYGTKQIPNLRRMNSQTQVSSTTPSSGKVEWRIAPK
jgi:hypothetical protein